MNDLLSRMREGDFSTNLAGYHMDSFLMPGGGYCKSLTGEHSIAELSRQPLIGAWLIGSFTLNQKEGHPGNVYFPGPGFAINAIGLRNRGLPYLINKIPIYLRIAQEAGKLLVVSIAPDSIKECLVMIRALVLLGVKIIVINMGCPNLWDAYSGHATITCYQPALVDKYLFSIRQMLNSDPELAATGVKLGLKLSPFFDVGLIEEIDKIIGANQDIIQFVAAINTVPTTFAFNDDGVQAITIGMGLGGMSGSAVFPIALGNIIQHRKYLPDEIDIIGVGGVDSGRKAIEMVKVGATAVKVVTALFNRGPRIFSDIMEGVADELGLR